MLHIVAIVILLKFGSDHPIPLLDIILRFPTAVHCSANKTFNSGCQTLCALPPTCSAAPLFHIFLCTSTIQPYRFFFFFFLSSCPILILISSLRVGCFPCAEPCAFLYDIIQINLDVSFSGKRSLK